MNYARWTNPRKVRVLVVDDDWFFLRDMGKTLRQAGYTVGLADGCPSAIEELAASRWDLVIMDLRMPYRGGTHSEEAGFGLLRYIKENQPGARVAVLTALSGSETMQRCMDLGATACLTKNSSSGKLLSRILLALPPELRLPEMSTLHDG